MLSKETYYEPQPGESFAKPACPLLSLREQVPTTTTISGWRAWARYSLALAKPMNAAKAASYATGTAEAFKTTACSPGEVCPYNASATVHVMRAQGKGSHAHGHQQLHQ